MPELPEVQTVISHLQPSLVGKTIQSIKNPNGYKAVLENGLLSNYKNFLLNIQRGISLSQSGIG